MPNILRIATLLSIGVLAPIPTPWHEHPSAHDRAAGDCIAESNDSGPTIELGWRIAPTRQITLSTVASGSGRLSLSMDVALDGNDLFLRVQGPSRAACEFTA
jgi:hypothetical protein